MPEFDPSESERRLAAIEEALERLEGGTYGRCLGCGAVIPDDELAGDPLVRTCAACRQAAEPAEA